MFLRLRERLKQAKNAGKEPNSKEIRTPVSPTEPMCPIPDTVTLNDRERTTADKVLRLIKLRIPVNKDPPTGPKVKILIEKYVWNGPSFDLEWSQSRFFF